MANSRLEILIVALAGLLAPVVQAQQTWALDAVKIYPAPDMAPISGKVVIAGTKIQSVVPASETRAMAAARAPQCKGGVVVAGFQNSHLHFTSDEFLDARDQPAPTSRNLSWSARTTAGSIRISGMRRTRFRRLAIAD